ncbi:hypothetical protein [Chryseobacterium flavum]|uniref:hypothetical protein n=1 Tax=Chryseobacterium flavum TaxID=415851 RepID=UPI0028AEF870|nr:hypothetical protein [Chryseobacterium flavum]
MKSKNIKRLTRNDLKTFVGGLSASCVCNYGGTVSVTVSSMNSNDLLDAANQACGFSGGVDRCVSNP